MKSSRKSDADAISNFPCNVVERILGCLPLKDAVKTSILSKGWRYKWVTRQELNFDYNFFKSRERGQDANTIIYQILLLHKGPILKFTLRGPDLRGPDIDHWILFLSNKNVHELTLHTECCYHLPSRLFDFEQLRHLKLYRCLFHPLPRFKGFEKLINLDLEHVTFDPKVFRSLISGCPLLEQLSLGWCTDFDDIEIDAPSLRCFEYRGRRSKSICFKNTPMLWKELELGGNILEYLTMGGVPENPPTALNNLKSLSIARMSFGNVEEVSGFVYLIRSCPKLQEITIDCVYAGRVVVEPVIQFLRAQSSSSYGVAKLLRRVKLEWFDGLGVEMEFMKFILASAPVLEEVSIWNPNISFHQGTQRIDEMKQLCRASPNVEFTLEVCAENFMPIEHELIFEVP